MTAGPVAAELGVVRAVHHAHAALAEDLIEAKPSETRVGAIAHIAGLVDDVG